MMRVLITLMLAGAFVVACESTPEGEVETTPDAEVAVETADTEAMDDTEVDAMDRADQAEMEETVEDEGALLPSWVIRLGAIEGSGIGGEGTARALPDGGTRVEIGITGADPNAQHPWHVHDGQCGSNGPIVGDAAAYSVLTADADGSAAGTATISVSLDPEADYYINIHKSPSETETIVACGELTGRTMN